MVSELEDLYPSRRAEAGYDREHLKQVHNVHRVHQWSVSKSTSWLPSAFTTDVHGHRATITPPSS